MERLIILRRIHVDPTEFRGATEGVSIFAELDLDYQGIVHGLDRGSIAKGVGRAQGIADGDPAWDYVHDCPVLGCSELREYEDAYVKEHDSRGGRDPLSA